MRAILIAVCVVAAAAWCALALALTGFGVWKFTSRHAAAQRAVIAAKAAHAESDLTKAKAEQSKSQEQIRVRDERFAELQRRVDEISAPTPNVAPLYLISLDQSASDTPPDTRTYYIGTRDRRILFSATPFAMATPVPFDP